MNEKPNLDLLRSVAVTCVVVAHTLVAKGVSNDDSRTYGLHLLGLGLFGVYMFFVHTSLVLMWSLQRRPNPLDFYIRRIFRLYPLAIVATLLAAVTHAPVMEIGVGTFQGAPVTVHTILSSCLLMHGLIGHGAILNGVMWSLPPELFMYILLPALFFYARSIKKIWPLLVIWALVVGLNMNHSGFRSGNDFPVLIPDFIAGIIAYVGFMHRRPSLPAWVMIPLLALLGVAVCQLPVRTEWFACLALGLLLPSIKQFEAKWLASLTHTVATYSYGIYLFHPFAIVLGIHVLAGKPLAIQLAVELLPLIVVVYIVYHTVEKPMIAFGARLAARLAHERGLPSERSLETLEPAP